MGDGYAEWVRSDSGEQLVAASEQVQAWDYRGTSAVGWKKKNRGDTLSPLEGTTATDKLRR